MLRTLAKVLLLAGAVASGHGVAADVYPSRPIRIICPAAAGTSSDIASRLVANALSTALVNPVVVDNRVGANGNLAMEYVANSAPDGYTLVIGHVGTHGINPELYARIPFDPIRSFVPVTFAGYTPNLLVVPESLPVRNVSELVALAKSKPGKLTFSSSGNGTTGQLAGELIKARTGTDMLHVPYKDATQGLTDLIAGRVDFMFYHPGAAMPHIKSGKLRAIGISSGRRSPAYPDIPTISEQGIEGFDLVAWWMLYAPSGTPAPVLARLRAATEQNDARAEYRAALQAQGFEPNPMNAAQLDAFARSELVKWADLVKRAKARID